LPIKNLSGVNVFNVQCNVPLTRGPSSATADRLVLCVCGWCRYDVMSQCWCENPADRPSFERLRFQLETLLCRDVTYLELDNIDTPLAAQSQSTPDDDDDDDVHDTSTSSTLLALHLDVC